MPKLRRGSLLPSVLEPRRRIDRALHAVIMEAYVAGVSTRSVDDLVAALGAESGISKSRSPRPGGAQVAGGCVGDHRDTPLGEGCGAGGAGAQAGPSAQGPKLRARGCPRRDLSPDRGCEGPGDRVGHLAGKSGLGLGGAVPARVGAEVKQMVLDAVDGAVAAGLAHRWAAALWGVSDDRVHRWRARRVERGGRLGDRRPGGAAMHALLAQEVDAILEIAEQWGPTDRSHRKLAPPSSRSSPDSTSASSTTPPANYCDTSPSTPPAPTNPPKKPKPPELRVRGGSDVSRHHTVSEGGLEPPRPGGH